VRLDHAWIAAHIPQQGSMCLLEEVLAWEPLHILCSSRSHRSENNPLRAHGRLGAACAIEYAAQAMAIHSVLLQGAAGAPGDFGMLASARGVEFTFQRLDELPVELQVSVQRLHADSLSALYAFELRAPALAQVLARGRLSALLATGGARSALLP